MIERVEYSRTSAEGDEGLRLIITYNFGGSDIYEFYDQPDIDHLISLIKSKVDPGVLIVEVRRIMRITVH